MSDNTALVRCSHCHEWLTPERFNRSKNTKNGLDNTCRQCRTEHRKRAREARGDKLREYHKRWMKDHPGKETEYNKRYRNTHAPSEKSRINASRRASRYAKEHPEWSRANASKRKARKRGNGGAYTADDVKAQYKRQHGRCYYGNHPSLRDGKPYQVDHVIPLSRGGSNGPDNIVIACYKCNDSKGTKLPHEWPQGGRLL